MSDRRDEASPCRGYQADPHEAGTDLMLEGIAVLKVGAGIALWIVLVLAAPALKIWQLSILWVCLVAAELVVLELAASAIAIRRGRDDPRTFKQLAMGALGIIRRYWFVVVYPALNGTGWPFWAKLAVSTFVIYVVEFGIERFRRYFAGDDVVAEATHDRSKT